MIIKFSDEYLELLYMGEKIPGKPKFSHSVVIKFQKVILLLSILENVSAMQQFNGLNFKRLKGDLKDYCSVRVDKQYRLILSVEGEEFLTAEILIVEKLSNHYQ